MEKQNDLTDGFTPVVPQVYDTTGKPIQIDYKDLPAYVSQGKAGFLPNEKIPALDQSGNPVSISPDQVTQAIDAGYKIDTPEMQTQRYLFKKYGSGTEALKAGIEGVASGATLGLSRAFENVTGISTSQEQSLRKEANPIASGSGEVLGTIAPLILSAGTAAPAVAGAEVATQGGLRAGLKALASATPVSLVSKTGMAAAEGATDLLAKAGISGASKNLAARMIAIGAPKMAGSALEGAIYGAGNAIDESALGNADLNAEHLLSNIGVGSLIGLGGGLGVLGIEAASPLLEKIVDKSKNYVGSAAKKSVSTLFGVSEDTLDKYVEKGGKDFLKNTPSLETGSLAIHDDLEKTFNDVAEKKTAAQGALRDTQDLARDAKDAARDAKVEYMNSADNDALDIAKRTVGAVNDLRDKALAASDQTFVGLEGKTVKLAPIEDSLNELKKKYSEYGLPGESTVKKLDDYLTDIKTISTDGEIPADLLKRRIQGLDQATKNSYGQNATEFTPMQTNALKSARFSIDDVLKDAIPEYRAAMKPVAEDFSLLSNLGRYGDEQSVLRSLKNMGSIDRETFDKPLIKKLEARTGLKVSDDIDKYINRKDLFAGTKAAKDAELYQTIVQKLKSPELESSVINLVKDSPELLSAIEKTQSFQNASKAIQTFGDVTPQNIGAIFKRAMGEGYQAELAKRQLIELDKGADVMGMFKKAGIPADAKNMEELLEKMKLADRFSKGNRNGSANVNFFGIVGGLISQSLGHMPLIGAAIGAGLGKADDKFGPKIAQYILDKYTTLAALERKGMDVAKELNSHISKFLGAPSTSEGLRKVIMPTTIQENDKKKKDNGANPYSKKMSTSEFKKASENISRIVGDPNGAVNNLSTKLLPVSKYAPQIAQSMSVKSAQAAQYLYSKMPKDPLSAYNIKPEFSKYEPSDYELSKFSRIYQAVNKPQSILKDMDRGTISSEQVDVMKNVYPEMYQSVKNQILSHVMDMKEDLPYSKKLTLGLLFDAPISAATNPNFIMMLQNNASSSSAQAEQANGPGAMSNENIKIDSKAISSRQSGSESILDHENA